MLDLDAETSSDELFRFRNQQRLSFQSRLLACLSRCHPGLDPGSALLKKTWLGVAGWGLEEQEKRLTVERFSVLRKERLQVPRCKL